MMHVRLGSLVGEQLPSILIIQGQPRWPPGLLGCLLRWLSLSFLLDEGAEAKELTVFFGVVCEGLGLDLVTVCVEILP